MNGHQHFVAINQVIQELVEHPESFDAEALQDVAGVLLDLNIYANQLHAELTAAQFKIALLCVRKATLPLSFSLD